MKQSTFVSSTVFGIGVTLATAATVVAAAPPPVPPAAATKGREPNKIAAADMPRLAQLALRQAPVDVVAVTALATTLQSPPRRQVTFTVKNTSPNRLKTVGWQLILHSPGNIDTFLGVDRVSDMAAGATATFTATFSRSESNLSVEAVVDPQQLLEQTAAQRVNNIRTLAIPGEPPPAGTAVVALNMDTVLAANATNAITGLSGTAGCHSNFGSQGTAVSANANCAYPGSYELAFLDNYSLKNGWNVNGVRMAAWGNLPFVPHHVPLAGTPVTKVTLALPSRENTTGDPLVNTTLFFMSMDAIGPTQTSPY